MTRLSALKSALLATCALLPGAAFAQDALPTFEIVGVSPVQGSEIARDKIPSNVETIGAKELDHSRAPSLLDGILQSVPGVSLSDQTGNAFQRDLNYRGQTASPVLGTPQGIAVYQNGTRINEAFGDVVNWDLIPEMAIARLTLQPNNPLFGLNATGGALSIEMKNGFTYQGGETQLFGGSFGRIQSGAQYGWNNGTYSAYIAAEGAYDRGWRDYSSASQVRRMYADFGARGDTTEFHLSFTGADNKLGSVAATPIEMLNQRWSSVYTWPQSLRLQMQMVQASLKWAPTDTLSIQANGYYRNYKSSRIDGNGTDAQACDTGIGLDNQFCIGDGQTPLNQNIPTFNTLAADTALGQIDRNTVKTDSYGGSLQATSTTQLFGHDNHFVVGASVDHGNTNFAATSELGTIDNNLFVTGLGVYIDQPNAGLAPVNLNAKNTYLGVYATNTFDITSQLAFTAGGRFNWAQINLRDQSGVAPLLNSDNNFQRFNPVVGLTYKITPNMTAYAGYSEANRAPTPLELGCSDPNNPCLIDNFLIADPPLKQVVSRTVEGGLRGEISGGGSAYAAAPPPYRKAPVKAVAVDEGWKLRWGISLFRTENSDDILQIVDPANPVRGYFKNAGTTLRQGVEAKLDLTWNRWTAYANYTFIDATFRSAFDVNDPFLGVPVGVVSGNHIPGIPAHRLKLGAEYAVTDAWKVGASVNYVGSQYLLHDETNVYPKVPAYWVVNVNTSYQVTKNVEVFGLIQNLFNQRYYSAGTVFDPAGFNTAGGGTAFALNDPRSMVPGMPLAAYAGIRAKF
ncbi:MULTISPECIES: TonB-dependent receptor [unclassified Bradyrhizobium]|uniref:TonB-dependent receptor n=1 Tax=unclassified Bradyrhizobium TaxID=2631580 RepID=UPI0024E0BFD1|nr:MULTISPECIES: TonB-dependent receptor [unclassified Bradyrhizobium]